MAAQFPFTISRTVAIVTLVSGTLIFNISSGETFFIERIQCSINTALVGVTNIRDQRGRSYLLGDTVNFLPLAQIGNAVNANELNPLAFSHPLIIEPNGTMYIDVYNGSAGTINPFFIAAGYKEIGNIAGV